MWSDTWFPGADNNLALWVTKEGLLYPALCRNVAVLFLEMRWDCIWRSQLLPYLPITPQGKCMRSAWTGPQASRGVHPPILTSPPQARLLSTPQPLQVHTLAASILGKAQPRPRILQSLCCSPGAQATTQACLPTHIYMRETTRCSPLLTYSHSLCNPIWQLALTQTRT